MLLEGKKVYVGPFQKRQERPEDGEVRFTNVYVKNVAESVSDEKLREMFAEFGEVTSAVIMKVRVSMFRGGLTSVRAISSMTLLKGAFWQRICACCD